MRAPRKPAEILRHLRKLAKKDYKGKNKIAVDPVTAQATIPPLGGSSLGLVDEVEEFVFDLRWSADYDATPEQRSNVDRYLKLALEQFEAWFLVDIDKVVDATQSEKQRGEEFSELQLKNMVV
mmetsp:Transcript_9620/g.16154  ORF Transcript_9620/g.16154 Transcript_9620/m.16154 type:complete len:123 (+) Transcript_9620:974-1342(+)